MLLSQGDPPNGTRTIRPPLRRQVHSRNPDECHPGIGTAYDTFKDDAIFQKELNTLYQNYASRPSLLTYAENVTKDLAGAKIYLKREDLNHTGSHKINNVLGQCF